MFFLPFDEIEINKNEVEQSLLNIDEKARANDFTWQGQFSPQFIEVMLEKYAHKGDFVVDPFCGCGTVMEEASRKGLNAYGMELNPAPYHMAKTYEFVNISFDQRAQIVCNLEDFLLTIPFSQDVTEALLEEINQCEEGLYQTTLKTLVILMDVFKYGTGWQNMMGKWEKLKKIITNLPYKHNSIHVDSGDSRNMRLENDCCSLLITSPPYINVFNYHQKYRESVELLGYNVLDTAKTEFGSNRKNRTNRFLTVIQYCIDLALQVNESIRICRDGARMIYIVGRESTVLGHKFCNSKLVYNIFTQIYGIPLDVRQERAFKNRFGKIIYEDIIHFINNGAKDVLEEEIIERARMIAINELRFQYKNSGDEVRKLKINEAIIKADSVNKSEEVHL